MCYTYRQGSAVGKVYVLSYEQWLRKLRSDPKNISLINSYCVRCHNKRGIIGITTYIYGVGTYVYTCIDITYERYPRVTNRPHFIEMYPTVIHIAVIFVRLFIITGTPDCLVVQRFKVELGNDISIMCVWGFIKILFYRNVTDIL